MKSHSSIAGGEAKPAAHDDSTLSEELLLVDHELIVALADLDAPFGQLVQRQLRRIQPLVRAAVVLTAGVGDPDSTELRTQRVYLGAALEMLHLALRIHTRLLAAPGERFATDRSMMGSTILAGDFCFSRSASLAVRTNSAAVVDIFAQALKDVSEGHLRRLFTMEAVPFDENRELFASGIMAAGTLAGLAPESITAAICFGDKLASAIATNGLAILQPHDAPTEFVTQPQGRRWLQLITWVRGQ